MTTELDRYYQDFRQRFSQMSEEELIEAFNREVGNPGWVSVRGEYLFALQEEFARREIDFSAIGDETRMSLANKIGLSEKTIIVLPPPEE